MFGIWLGAGLTVVGLSGAALSWLWFEASRLGDELGEAAARGFAEGAAEVMGGEVRASYSVHIRRAQSVVRRFERADGNPRTSLRESLS